MDADKFVQYISLWNTLYIYCMNTYVIYGMRTMISYFDPERFERIL